MGNTKDFVITVTDPERLILPLPDLLKALGRSQIAVSTCEDCGKHILTNTLCVSCAKSRMTTRRTHEIVIFNEAVA